jgi:hypothetical protein
MGCNKDLQKKRTRLCVGLKALLTDCKCAGPATQLASCGENATKKPSAAVLAVSRLTLSLQLKTPCLETFSVIGLTELTAI